MYDVLAKVEFTYAEACDKTLPDADAPVVSNNPTVAPLAAVCCNKRPATRDVAAAMVRFLDDFPNRGRSQTVGHRHGALT